jgi:hypothetical protein
MLELIQITNDPLLARRCDAIEGMRLWVDLERQGKAERQAGRNSFISTHSLEDVGRVKAELRRARLMVRLDPLHAGTPAEVDSVIAQGADLLMLPMFPDAHTLGEFARIVDGRRPVVPLLETAGALACLPEWIATPGLAEVYVGLNDLHLSLGHRFMFEALAMGLVDRVADAARSRGLRFGFGGIAQLDGGLLPGRDVLAEHLRLGSGAVILSRSFAAGSEGLEAGVAALRKAEQALARRGAAQVQADRARIAARIGEIAAGLSA